MKPMTICLWFDGQAEEAARFYTAIFKGSKVLGINRYGDAGPGPKGKVMTVRFRLGEQEFLGLNGGPQFKFNESVSLVVPCKTQKEIDRYWTKLTKGGKEVQCGWLKDKFGLSWQIVPDTMGELVSGKDPEAADRVMQAVLKMVKLDIAKLKKAYAGK
jgi:predicted 3-demethylubiquinone-9 3-methyltransferase (glyoxalase superfamily)